MKRLLLSLALVLMVCTTWGQTPTTYTDVNSGLEFTTITEGDNSPYAVITGPNIFLGRLVIPEKVKEEGGTEYPVVKIGDEAFRDNYDITFLSIPATVTHIGKSSFNNCPGITTAFFATAPTLGNECFWNNKNEGMWLYFGTGVTSIPDGFFSVFGFSVNVVLPSTTCVPFGNNASEKINSLYVPRALKKYLYFGILDSRP